MVRRVGFGDAHKQGNPSEPEGEVVESATRTASVPNARKKNTTAVEKFQLITAVAKTTVLLIIGLQIDSLVGYILIGAAAFSLYDLFKIIRKRPKS